MTIENDEALKERARGLYTVPTEISGAVYLALSPQSQGLYAAAGDHYVLQQPASSLSAPDRFRLLHDLGRCNGIRRLLVQTVTDVARMDVHFYNRNGFAEIDGLLAADPEAAAEVLPITGGRRVPAGSAPGQVQVVDVDVDLNEPVLHLTMTPVGDYSTYTLHVSTEHGLKFDPLFSEVDFKFRPGCFTTDCDRHAEGPGPAPQNPTIDYLAKDYDSFRHTLISAMRQRVPNWEPTSEADLDEVLIDLFSAAADELSDLQDRVMNETYLATARKRVSLARHARLMDYHIHQGQQATTWLALELRPDTLLTLPRRVQFWTGLEKITAEAQVFITRAEGAPLLYLEQEDIVLNAALRDAFMRHRVLLSNNCSLDIVVPQTRWLLTDHDNGTFYCCSKEDDQIRVDLPNMHPLLNRMALYTWSGARVGLERGSEEADLQVTPAGDEPSAHVVESWIHDGRVTHLLIQESLNPEMGELPGVDTSKRQVVKLLAGHCGAQALADPVTGLWLLRVRWQPEDKLRHDFRIAVLDQVGQPQQAAFFNGNLVEVHHGRPRTVVFQEKDVPGTGSDRHSFQRTDRKGAWCRLPDQYVAYRQTAPGGEDPPQSTVEVSVETAGKDPWEEVISLVHSDGGAESGDQFAVETDELGWSTLRFGNGTNGRALPEGARVHCFYQAGRGPDGNVGADAIVRFEASLLPEVAVCWNPLDVTSGLTPEPVAEIIRRAPEAFRARQLRAVTLADYERRAKEVAGVSNAAARYAWTGSWRTVRIAIDPVGATELTRPLRDAVWRHLNAVRLIGEDLEIRAPHYVPLKIVVRLCLLPDYWQQPVEHLLEDLFSDGYAPDGRPAFFHPDRWTFGQSLHRSEILGWLGAVEGVDHVVEVNLQRWYQRSAESTDQITVGPDEIIQVRNDPDHQEDGRIDFVVQGGRR